MRGKIGGHIIRFICGKLRLDGIVSTPHPLTDHKTYGTCHNVRAPRARPAACRVMTNAPIVAAGILRGCQRVQADPLPSSARLRKSSYVPTTLPPVTKTTDPVT